MKRKRSLAVALTANSSYPRPFPLTDGNDDYERTINSSLDEDKETDNEKEDNDE